MDISIIVIIGIVIFIVIGILRSVAKKARANQQKQADNQQPSSNAAPPSYQQQQPKPMSDIQKAFFMMNDDADTNVHHEGRTGRHEGTVSRHEGLHSHEGYAGKKEGTRSHEGYAGKKEGTHSYEGYAGKKEGIEFHGNDAHKMHDPYANVDLKSTYHNRHADSAVLAGTKKQQKPALNLFKNKDDYFKAVVYSEILTRKSR